MERIEDNNRILIIDDNPSIHNDFKKILINAKRNHKQIDNLEKFLFGDDDQEQSNTMKSYILDCAYDGNQAIKMVKTAKKEQFPYALAFVDIRMPPGLDGIETIAKIWDIDPFIQIAICTAYSDYSWDGIISKLGFTDQIIILKKPFEKIEIKQMAASLVQKWNLSYRVRKYVKELENKIKKKIETITSIIEFANRLNSMGDLDEICSYIIEYVSDLIKASRISIMLVDEKREILTIKKSVGIPEDIIKKTIIKPGEGITGKVFLSDKPIIINDITNSEYQKKYSSYDSFLSAPFICTPLKGNKIKLGVINVTNKKENLPFTSEEEQVMSYISYAAAVAINNQVNEMKVEDTYLGSIKAMVGAIEAKDPYTKGHSERVSALAGNIAKELNLPLEQIKIITFAGLVHDIGKIGIPESILCKPGSLTDKEYEQIKEHPIIGEHILKDIKFLNKVKEIVRHHHERLDGSGYPDNLHENEISMESKIMAIADTYDAMRSDRPYRKGIQINKIKKELSALCDIKYDRKCVHTLFSFLGI